MLDKKLMHDTINMYKHFDIQVQSRAKQTYAGLLTSIRIKRPIRAAPISSELVFLVFNAFAIRVFIEDIRYSDFYISKTNFLDDKNVVYF
jgi:hypothetical protein